MGRDPALTETVTRPNTTGLNKTLRHLREADKIKPEHSAAVALAKALAAAVDADPCGECGAGQNAALWREYRAAVASLMSEVGTGDDLDEATTLFRISVQTPRAAPMGDAEDT